MKFLCLEVWKAETFSGTWQARWSGPGWTTDPGEGYSLVQAAWNAVPIWWKTAKRIVRTKGWGGLWQYGVWKR